MKTKFSKDTVRIAEEYYQECIEEDKTPYLGKLAIKLGIHRDTLYEWGNSEGKYYVKSLSDVLKKIKSLTETRLMEIVLGERKGSMIGAIFLLKSKFGYIEANKVIAEGNSPVTVQVDMSGGYLPPSQPKILPQEAVMARNYKKPIVDKKTPLSELN